jgi:hypothetical protein
VLQGQGEVMSDIQTMVGKKVLVTANGIIYSGELIEVSDVEVYLKGSMQWLSLPVSSVSDIKLAEQTALKIDEAREV